MGVYVGICKIELDKKAAECKYIIYCREKTTYMTISKILLSYPSYESISRYITVRY
jgi:hypothetical protein